MSERGQTEYMKPRPYTLDCMHQIYLRYTPKFYDIFWCYKCENYEPLLMAATSKHSEIYDPSGEFKATRKGKYLLGECLHDKCEFVSKSVTSYNNLQSTMHSHYMRTHTRWGAIEIKKVERLPPGSPPPF